MYSSASIQSQVIPEAAEPAPAALRPASEGLRPRVVRRAVRGWGGGESFPSSSTTSSSTVWVLVFLSSTMGLVSYCFYNYKALLMTENQRRTETQATFHTSSHFHFVTLLLSME